MKRISIAVTSLACLGLISSAASAGPVKHRLNNQEERIFNGVQNGSLTYDEYKKLDDRQDKLELRRQKEKRDGGELTGKEFVRFNQGLNRQSRQIYRQKHD